MNSLGEKIGVKNKLQELKVKYMKQNYIKLD